MNRIVLIFISAVVAAALAAGLPACSERPKGEPIIPKDGVFSIDATKLGTGDVRFFSYEHGGKDIAFFVARSDAGEIKTAFDACITCYPHKMGYRQEAGSVVCRYCGNRFKLKELDKGVGNCVPIKINHRIEGDRVLIDQKEVEAGAAWF